MADADAHDVPTSTDLIVVEAQQNAVALFTDEKRYSEFYDRVRASVADFVPDLTTEKGRREIATIAFRVTKAKTTLDKAGFALTEEWRQKTNAVNAARKKMTTELDQLAAEVRRPLTEWEENEAARQQLVDERIAWLRNAATVREGETAADVETRGRDIFAIELGADLFQDRMQEAQDAKDATVQALAQAMRRMRQEEADRAELERLRLEAREREEADRLAAEARDKEELERRAREEEILRAQQAEERRKAEIAAAEERARVEADERARAEERRESEEKLAVERRAREAAEREADETRRREEERAAWEAKEKREREAREADERHRKAVIDEIAADIAAAAGEQSDSAIPGTVATAIAAGTIRHVSVRF